MSPEQARGARRRRALRHLFARLRRVRGADRQAAVPGRRRVRDRLRARVRADPAPAARPCAHWQPLIDKRAREERRRALREHRRIPRGARRSVDAARCRAEPKPEADVLDDIGLRGARRSAAARNQIPAALLGALPVPPPATAPPRARGSPAAKPPRRRAARHRHARASRRRGARSASVAAVLAHRSRLAALGAERAVDRRRAPATVTAATRRRVDRDATPTRSPPPDDRRAPTRARSPTPATAPARTPRRRSTRRPRCRPIPRPADPTRLDPVDRSARRTRRRRARRRKKPQRCSSPSRRRSSIRSASCSRSAQVRPRGAALRARRRAAMRSSAIASRMKLAERIPRDARPRRARSRASPRSRTGYVDLAEKRYAEGKRSRIPRLPGARRGDRARPCRRARPPAQRVNAAPRAACATRRLEQGKAATTAWDQAGAIAAFERALVFDPESKDAQRGLATAKTRRPAGLAIPRRQQGPELVVAEPAARARGRAHAKPPSPNSSATGRRAAAARAAASRPACRDRESFFRGGSKQRSFDSPGLRAGRQPSGRVRGVGRRGRLREVAVGDDRQALPTADRVGVDRVRARRRRRRELPRATSATRRYGAAYNERDAYGCDDGHAETAPVASYDASRGPGIHDARRQRTASGSRDGGAGSRAHRDRQRVVQREGQARRRRSA